MSERILGYLSARDDGATSEEIALEALNLRGAVGPVARAVVRAAVEADPRIVEGADGRWRVCQAGEGQTPLRACRFVAMALARDDSRRVSMISAVRTDFTRDDRAFDAAMPESSEGLAKALSALEGFAGTAVPAGFRYGRTREALNGVSRRVLGRPVVGSGLCLYRMARRLYPHRSFRSVGEVAAAAGLSHMAEAGPSAEAALQAEVLLFLLEDYLSRGVTTVEAVAADQLPTSAAVSFDAFAFDEADLQELPREPGVYAMRDAEGRVIYVGKSVSLQDRVRTYFARRLERPEKTRRILDRIWSVEVQKVGSELEALMLEARLIHACRPEFNTQQAVHEREAVYDAGKRFVVVLPAAEAECAALFCVAPNRPVEMAVSRCDLVDWPSAWRQCEAFFTEVKAAPLGEEEQAAHRILQSWLARNRGRVNVVDVASAGPMENLERLLKDHLRSSALEGWRRVWQV